MFGYKPEEKQHKPSEWQKIIFEEDLTIALENFDKHVKTRGVHPFAQESRYHHKDGSTVTVLCRGQVVEWAEDGTPIRMIGTHTNITESKQAEELREILIEQLTISNGELDNFAYIASHDLKEPLRGLHNHSKLLMRDYHDQLDDDGKHKLDRIIYLTQRMEALINDLLYYSRIGRTELAIKNTNLNDVVRDVKETFMASETEGNLEITIAKKLPTIKCDTMRVTELFRNLISNGLKYNESDKKCIEIGVNTTKGRKKEKVLYVKDNGIGIEEKFHDDIFRIFKRLHKRDAYGGGTGSGLTFVKKIVEKHGGKIWLESEKGNGTVFYFTLPEKESNNE